MSIIGCAIPQAFRDIAKVLDTLAGGFFGVGIDVVCGS